MARTGFGRKDGNGSATGVADLKAAPSAKPHTPAAVVQAPVLREVKPSLEQVRQKAFELYQARAKAGKPGDSTTDWLEAERQLKTALPR